MELIDFFIRVFLAFTLGSIIGLERQWRQRMAGLRTNALVATGAALFVSLGAMTPDEVSPTRVAAQVVSGIGFLGAGVIFKEGLNVSGLNTAATIWATGAVGVLAGSGFLIEATIGTVAVVTAHMALRPLGYLVDRLPHKPIQTLFNYDIELIIKSEDEVHIRSVLLKELQNHDSAKLMSLKSQDLDDPSFIFVHAKLQVIGKNDYAIEKIVRLLSLEPTVSSINWETDSWVGD